MIKNKINNEQGFVLIVSLLMLMVLMIIGIAATNTTTIELQISGNDKVSKQTFYQAEAGIQVGTKLVEDSRDAIGSLAADIGLVHINTPDLYLNEKTATPIDWSTDVDAYLPNTAASNVLPRTDLIFRGETKITPGSAIQMVAGYEGKGKATASGGAVRLYDIWSRHSGHVNSEATIVIEYADPL